MSSNPRRGKKGPSPNPEECPKIPMFLNPEGDKMSEVKWTEEQSQAIHEKGSNILVAAAAGSGKTAVLVERIINKIIEEEIDIDKLLVVTFTNAAASEMRERILNAIYKKIEEEPTNLRLQKQITLLNKSNICTIHSFCLDVIRNNFYEINISPNFRIGDTAEIELLKEEVLDELFEDLYLKEDEGFLKLLEIYTSYKDDEPLKDIVKSIYNFIQSAPFPEKWLAEKVKLFDIDIENTDFAETVWGKIILNNYKECIEENILGLKKIKKELEAENELEKFSQAIRLDIENLESLLVNLNSWDKSYELAKTFSFVRWPSSKKINSETPAFVKEKRDMINAKFKKLKDSIFIYTSAEVLSDLKNMYEVLNLLQAIILKFNENYKKAKLERNIIDFNDIEHLALKILIKDEDGKYVPSEIAKKYQDKFEEIAIDEYQDSNMVQEYILTSISKGNNIFMVGDVKQSIYKFRQAMPELFLNKYKTYKLKKEKTEADDLKIQLFKNFRSRKNILDTTNIIFQEIMSKDLGDVDYNEDEYLNLGANYEEPQLENIDFAGKTEINIINLEDTTKDSQEDEEDNVKTERIENSILEARYVAQKINELINSNYYVLDKKEGYRKVTYKDIVVLLRSTTELSPIYEKEISDLGMPVYSETSTEYLNSVEIQLIMSCLKIIDNPMQDIPLVTVMRSMIGGFTDNDLIEIRLADKYENFYESIVKARIQVNEELRNKIDSFLELINQWREASEFLALDELIWKIYMDTGYYNYVGLMQNGKLRQANLKMLFERAKQYESATFKGVFNFINFIDKLKLRNNDLGAAKIIGENENVIRIMSIHKSKGLEFPVVFLSSTGKNFNLKDLREKILIHQEIGFGPNYENSELKIEYPTLAKEAIKMVSKRESISEEMRVLYVALTRAKEKLIITGIEKDLQKSIESKEKELQIYESEDNSKINPKILESYKSYLDWIELVYLKNKIKNSDIFEFNVVSKTEILNQTVESETERKDVLKDIANKKVSKENMEKIKNILEWEYKYKDSTEMPSELSVSKIKELSKDTEEKIGITLKKPNFLIEKTELTPAEKGTIMHLCLQKLNYKEEYNLEKLKNMVNNLVNKEIILPKEAESVNYNKILAFLSSNIWKEMQTAKVVEQEKAFYLNLKANEIYQNDAEDEILVQGIIDLYYITNNDELVLVDYKTDYVENNNEQSLEDKYNIQLEIYKKALEESLNRKVDKVYIYSTWLNKEIEI
ncbi:aTP-dependent helicase/nuclease subunit A [Clostridium sp. CAG:354]|jgi:ATP-dependent helicase/nuclease subunit A|nr:aTP-dependent helicase/nuclease subunit A [Clostridium sp. CAG:354]